MKIADKSVKLYKVIVRKLVILLIALCYLSIDSDMIYAQNPGNAIEASGITILNDARVVVIEPDDYPMEIGSINRTIENEIDDNTIFELKRDAVYWTELPIVNPDHRLHIRAQSGDGHPPVIRSAVDLGMSAMNIHSTRDVILENLFFMGLNEMGVPEDQMTHFGENAYVVIDNCWFINGRSIQIWIEGSNNSFYITNSISKNVGNVGNDQNGRLIDTRSNSQDIIYIENNTLYNHGHAFLRNSGGVLGKLHMNHNTFMNLTQYIRVGEVQEMNITNNIFRNVYTIGEPVTSQERAFIEIRELPSGLEEHERILVVNNNNIGYLDEEFLPLIETRNAHHEDVDIQKAPNVSRKYMDPNNDLPLVNYESNIEERIDFFDPPNLEPYLVWTQQWMMGRDNIVPFNGEEEQPLDRYNYPPFYDLWEESDPDPEDPSVPPNHLYNLDLIRDFTYSNELESFTAAENGFPVGDLNWFPEQKEKWIAGDTPTSVEEEAEVVAEDFRIVGNYPNPFNPGTNIVFELASQVEVTLEVFNVLGQRVELMELGIHVSGRHEVTFDASGLPSGVYVLRMQMGEVVKTQNITLLK